MSRWQIDDNFGAIDADGRPIRFSSPGTPLSRPVPEPEKPYIAKDRTDRELIGDMWDFLIPAWFGSSLGAFSVCLLILLISAGWWRDQWFLTGGLFVCAVGGFFCAIPWHQAHGELKRRNDERNALPKPLTKQ